MRSGASYTEQELELGVAGKPKLHLACTVSPVELRDVALLLEFRHIDQQLKIAREERLQEQQQANRDLIRSLAHEIKNPLGGIRGAAQLLERELDRPQLIEYTQVIIGEADRLQLARQPPADAAPAAVLPAHQHPRDPGAREGRGAGGVPAGRPSCSDFDTSLPEFDADPEQLTQAVLNIVRNAAQARRRHDGRADDPARRRASRAASRWRRKRHRLALAISVADNGPGIPEALRDRIFFPLVSGREGGSGLGLTHRADVHRAAQRHDRMRERAGRTVFTILLPLEVGRAGA